MFWRRFAADDRPVNWGEHGAGLPAVYPASASPLRGTIEGGAGVLIPSASGMQIVLNGPPRSRAPRRRTPAEVQRLIEFEDQSATTGSPNTLGHGSLCEILRQLSRGRVARVQLAAILHQLADSLDCERIALFRNRTSGGFQVLVACNRDHEPLHSPATRMSHYAVKQSMTSGKPVLVEDARLDRRYRSEESLDGKRTAQAIVVLPVVVDGKLYGGIYADHRYRSLDASLKSADVGSELVKTLIAVVELALTVRDRQRAARRGAADDEISNEPAEVSAVRHARTSRRDRRERELESLLDTPAEAEEFHGFLSANPDLQDAFSVLRRLERADIPIVIWGETGTGKSLFARAAHECSNRRSGRFCPLHGSAIPETLVDSELLGHVRGSFTGAITDREGVLSEADGGTLFLDEAGEMNEELQTKLLRVLEDGIVRRLGAKDGVQVDLRVICASRRRLSQLVEEGSFRRDLYFRLKGVTFELPPLRDRPEDILPLAELFLARHGGGDDRGGDEVRPRLDRSAQRALLAHSWPGNVRELENEMRRLAALGLERVRAGHLEVGGRLGRLGVGGGDELTVTLDAAVGRAESDAIARALDQVAGNKSRAAKLLGITRKSLYRRMKKYGLDPSAPVGRGRRSEEIS